MAPAMAPIEINDKEKYSSVVTIGYWIKCKNFTDLIHPTKVLNSKTQL